MWLSVRQEFLRYDAKSSTDRLDVIKSKNFRSLKDTVKRVKRQVTVWEKVFAKAIADTGLAP